MDPIDRQEVLAETGKWLNDLLGDDSAKDIRVGIRMVRVYMKQMPTVKPEPQWILCSERNPEHGGWYIVTKNLTDDGDKAVCLSWYSLHGWEWGEAPIAWMPLPEPYREEGGQE